MKVTIEKLSNKYSPVILVDGRWLKVTEEAFKYAQKGEAEIEQDSNGVVSIVKMLGGTSNEKFPHNHSFPSKYPPSSSDPERERRIVRQSSMQRAVDLVIAGKFPLQQLFDTAYSIEQWVMRENDAPTS